MSLCLSIDRRTLLIGGGVGVGLVAAFALWPRSMRSALPTRPDEHAFGSFIKIGRDGRVTVAVPPVETGQGIWTTLPQVVADELGAAWETVGVEPAPLTKGYENPLAEREGWLAGLGTLRRLGMGRDPAMRMTAGSTSIRAFEQPMRDAAAVVRSMLVGAAAERWNVAPEECETADGFVLNGARTFTFGELAEEAAGRSPPIVAPRREGSRARLAGAPLPRLDAPSKANGRMRFAADVRLPDLLYASARIAPPHGRLTAFNRAAAEQVSGVRAVIADERSLAAIATTWWAAERAIKAADARFEGRANQPAGLRQLYADRLAVGDLIEHLAVGDYRSVVRGSRPLTATYWVSPALPASLETVSATARLQGGHLEVWAPTLAPEATRRQASATAGSDADRVTLYPMPVGDSGGGALEADAVVLAVRLARRTGRPIQLLLSQSASQNHGRPSGGALARLHALPSGGTASAWYMQLVAGGGFGAALNRINAADPPGELLPPDLAGSAPPYAIPNVLIEAALPDLPFEAGYMRGSPQRELSFFTESFVDELSRAVGTEPLAFRMAMLGSNGRLARCLQAAARLARWDGGRAGSTMGMAGCSAFGSHIGLVAVASIGEGQRVKAHRLVAAVDCGRVINAAIVRQQIEGGLLWALAQASTPAPEWVAGMPVARPIGGLALPRISDIPEIVVQLITSDAAPGGVSGLGTTVLAPAVANAIFAGTGRRLRSLPFDLDDAA